MAAQEVSQVVGVAAVAVSLVGWRGGGYCEF